MSKFIIAAAQSKSVKGDIGANIITHEKFVRVAAEHDVDVIIFPELSLTGYEPELAEQLTISVDDDRLQLFREFAQESGITIVAGAPLESSRDKPHIGALVYCPDRVVSYAKQHLHPGEEVSFSPGEEDCIVEVGGMTIGLAICADTAHASHAQKAAEKGADIYAAGVLITEGGYQTDAALFKQYARRHNMVVLMANHCAPTGGWEPAGKSAIWDNAGHVLGAMRGREEGMIVATKMKDGWTCQIVQS